MSPSRIYTPHMPLKRPILDLIYSVKSAIHHLIILIKSKYTYTTATSKTCHFDTYPNPNSPFIQHFLLIICEITTHIPLKYRILYDNTQCKVYHSMPLHTYTANFATSSILEEMLLTGMHTTSIPQTY